MAWLDRIKATLTSGARVPAEAEEHATTTADPPEVDPAEHPQDRWYVPVDGDKGRFAGPPGAYPTIRLIEYRDTGGEHVLRLCEDSTGLLIGPTDRRLPPVGVYVSQLRGEAYHVAACKRGDFAPGAPVRLLREPDNEFSRFAVAVTADEDGAEVAAYLNEQKARTVARLMDEGRPLRAISIRGTAPGRRCDQIAVLAAEPALVAHLLSPRPRHLPPPAHTRG